MDSGDQIARLKKLNDVSPSFCLAKWLQVTIDLVNGTTHSCHHPQRHLIPLEEIKRDVSALHNTQFKKQQRKLMLEGVRPAECSYCWDMEDIGNSYSDRYIKSSDPWAWPHLDEIKKMSFDENIAPTYLEVMIDNICNFSCAYCMADISTSVAAEMKKFGGYPVSNPHHRLSSRPEGQGKSEEYQKAFEKWLPEIMDQLRVLRVTGGEPLLSRQFWSLLSHIENSENSNLELIINTHLNHGPELINKLKLSVESLFNEKKIKLFSLYVSLDTFGQQAEYIRDGLSYSQVIQNIEKLSCEIPQLKVIIMCTFNILSIGGFDRFLKDVIELKKRHAVILDISCLKNPEYLRADMANDDLISMLQNHLDFMKSEVRYFSEHEYKKLGNIVNWAKSSAGGEKMNIRRSDFFRFINEFDRRKKKKFIEIFPEFKSFYIEAKKSAFLADEASR